MIQWGPGRRDARSRGQRGDWEAVRGETGRPAGSAARRRSSGSRRSLVAAAARAGAQPGHQSSRPALPRQAQPAAASKGAAPRRAHEQHPSEHTLTTP